MALRQEIYDGVNALLVQAFPRRKVYRDTEPKDFEQDSFFIALEKRTVSTLNHAMLEISQVVRIAVIGKLDAHGICDTDALSQCTDTLETIFWACGIPVGDRVLQITGLEVERTHENIVQLLCTLTYQEMRPNREDAADIMRRLHLRM